MCDIPELLIFSIFTCGIWTRKNRRVPMKHLLWVCLSLERYDLSQWRRYDHFFKELSSNPTTTQAAFPTEKHCRSCPIMSTTIVVPVAHRLWRFDAHALGSIEAKIFGGISPDT